MAISATGVLASSAVDGLLVDAADARTGELTTLAVRKFDGSVKHACCRLRTLSGAEAVFSNNSLVWPEGGQGFILAQSVMQAGVRIATLVDGVASWEPVVYSAPEPEMQDVVALLIPSGLMAVGTDPTRRIFTTERGNAPPNTRP